MPGKLESIPIAQIKVPPVRVTAVYDEELQKLLKESLDTIGQIQPIIVVQEDSWYWLVDGLHRLEEAKTKRETTIPAVVYDGTYKDTILKNLVLNRIHGKTKASEMVEVLDYLYKELGYDTDKVAQETGLGRDYVERILKIAQAAPAVRQALDQEVIGVGHAYEVSRLPSREAQEEVIAKQQLWRWSVKDLRQQVDLVLMEYDKLKNNPPAKRQVAPAIYSCDGCGLEADPRYLRPISVCPQCYGQIWRAKKAAEAPPAEDAAAADGGG